MPSRFADTPCTTVGLWKYAAAYDIFKEVKLEDVEAALQLEGALALLRRYWRMLVSLVLTYCDCIVRVTETTSNESGAMGLEFALYKPSSGAKEKLLAHVLGASDGTTADDFLKAVRREHVNVCLGVCVCVCGV